MNETMAMLNSTLEWVDLNGQVVQEVPAAPAADLGITDYAGWEEFSNVQLSKVKQ